MTVSKTVWDTELVVGPVAEAEDGIIAVSSTSSDRIERSVESRQYVEEGSETGM